MGLSMESLAGEFFGIWNIGQGQWVQEKMRWTDRKRGTVNVLKEQDL